MRHLIKFAGTALLLTVCASLLSAQEQQETAVALGSADTRKLESTSTDSSTTLNALKKTPDGNGIGLFGRFLDDQRPIWTSPARIRFSDMTWLVPVGGLTAGLLVTDRDFSANLSHDPKTMSHYNTLSNAGLAALIGGAGGLWLMGHASHNKHWKETGFLAGEASINSLVAVEAVKYSLRRQRPVQGDGSGAFFQGGTSFPSEHAAAAWSVAGVIAHEYPGPFTKIVAYGLASLVDYSRIRSRQHFPSDVFVGSIMGNLIAQNIYSRHHDPELGGAPWQSISQIFRSDGNSSPANQGSPYVPLDSWIYPALDRLTGLGLIDSGFTGLRPWTRRECARMLNDAEEKLTDTGEVNSEAQKLISALEKEFSSETEGKVGSEGGAFRVESVYSRTEHISGMPLTDGYTFAQTQINDFGRPYGEGWSTANGFSAYATRGPWVAYVRGEEQSAPSIPTYSLTTRQTIQQVDQYPQLPPDSPQPSVAQLSLLDAYVGLMLSNWQVSFGKQSLSWGPGDGGSMTLSNNAPPINMFRISRTTPLKLPGVFGWLGPIRTEFFLGQLAGYEFIFSPAGFLGQFGQSLDPQPFIHGQKISFKPTRNFEFGFFRTTIFGGPGYPFTLHSLISSLFTTGNSPAGSPDKPGKRTSGLDLSYRLPYLRNWLTFYAEGLAFDQFSPIAYADRSAWRAGLYLSQFPLVRKLDLRVEGVYTDNPIGGFVGHGFYYFNGTWRSGYTSNGNLLGSWIGREGQGAQAWSNYWFGARNRLQFNFRHQKVSQEFIPGGGTLTDVGVRGDYWVRSNLGLSVWVQHERWLFPVIQANATRNVTTAVEIMFAPQKLFQRSTGIVPQAASKPGGRP
jgi:membrane-associated phospholipid phosphatase